MRSPLLYPSSGQNTFVGFENGTFRSVGAAAAGGGDGSGASAGSPSRTHSAIGLSSRRRRKTGWRRRPSAGHSFNRTSQTSSGSTPGCPRPRGKRTRAGRARALPFAQALVDLGELLAGEAGADAAGVDQAAFLPVSQMQRAETPAAALGFGVTHDGEVAGAVDTHLDPVGRAPL